MNESLPGRIFISYRHQETAWPARQLYEVLVEHFSAERVFKDVDNIEPGDDFTERITAAVASCDVLLALIGPQWLTITDENGQRRLDDPGDWVRLEIETALTRKIRLIPILVDDARMPRATELPPTIASLVHRQAVVISPLSFDTSRLIATVRKTLADVKTSDSTGSASPRPTPRADHLSQQAAEPEVEQLYDQALAAFWTEQWDKATDLLDHVLERQPDYADAAQKRELARRQLQMASHYARATTAADAGNWKEAVAEYTIITDADPDYRDTNARLAEARHQQQLASLLAEAHRLHRAGQWAAVIKVGEQLKAIDPATADPDGLITSARTELAAEQQAVKLAADYHTALHLFDARRWEEAIKALEQVTRIDSGYQDAPALLNRARREVEQAAALVEEQARREAEEQREQTVQQQAEEQAEQARREAEEQREQAALQKSRKHGRWALLLTSVGLLVIMIIIALVYIDQANTKPYDKMLSHLPKLTKPGCSITDTPEAELAAAYCLNPSSLVQLWKTDSDARSSVLLTRDPWGAELRYGMNEGDCMHPPREGAGSYQYWSKGRRSGILACKYNSKYEYYTVAWSIDELAISGQLSSPFGAVSVNDYQELLSGALSFRDQVK